MVLRFVQRKPHCLVSSSDSGLMFSRDPFTNHTPLQTLRFSARWRDHQPRPQKWPRSFAIARLPLDDETRPLQPFGQRRSAAGRKLRQMTIGKDSAARRRQEFFRRFASKGDQRHYIAPLIRVFQQRTDRAFGGLPSFQGRHRAGSVNQQQDQVAHANAPLPVNFSSS